MNGRLEQQKEELTEIVKKTKQELLTKNVALVTLINSSSYP